MNKIIRKLRGREKGQALILALILLGVGSIVLVPLLGFLGDGLSAGVIVEDKTDELYACGAGVEDAVWKINNRDAVAGVPKVWDVDPPMLYNIANVNGNEVSVYIELVDPENSGRYRVRSYIGNTVVDNDTMIEAVVATVFAGDYGGIMDNVITSQGDYTLQGPTTVDPPEGEEHGPEGDYDGDWPTPEEIALYYWYDVYNLEPYDSDTLYVEDEEYQPPPAEDGLGPFFRDGTISIINSGTVGLTLQLNGTVYITGDTLIGTTNKAFTLDLNGHTIFVESTTGVNEDGTIDPGKYALEMGTKVTLAGSGAIIAVGSIQLKPNMDASPDDYIFVMSITGMTYMQPNGNFYGTIASSSEVWIQNGDLYYGDGPPDDVDGGINFPSGGSEEGLHWGIFTWEIT